MRAFALISAAVFFAFSSPAICQITTVTPGNSYLAVAVPPAVAGGGVCSVNCVNGSQGVPLDYYATSTNVNSQFAGVNSQIGVLNNQMNGFAAAVGAMRDAVPNAGDRFAVRFNASYAGNSVGGGFSASANLDDQFRATLSYGGSRHQNVVSGGLNFSFN